MTKTKLREGLELIVGFQKNTMLFSAKTLAFNGIRRHCDLDERQLVRVIEWLDLTTNVREVGIIALALMDVFES